MTQQRMQGRKPENKENQTNGKHTPGVRGEHRQKGEKPNETN